MPLKLHHYFITYALVVCGFAVAAPTEADPLVKYRQIENASPGTKVGLTATEREALFRHVNQHPVASPNRIDAFEPFPGDPARAIGYCFGRAMAVHLFARSMGVRSEAIRKLFIVGDLRQRGAPSREWGFHVTTVIQDATNPSQWYAIDPIMESFTEGKSQTVVHWIDTVREVWDSWRPDGRPRAKLFFTDNSAVIPEARDDRNPIWDFDRFNPELPRFSFGDVAHEAFEVDAVFRDRHFAAVEEPGADAFPFLGIYLTVDVSTGPEYFDFKNYFVRLLSSVISTRGRIPVSPVPPMIMGTNVIAARRPHGTEVGNGKRRTGYGMSAAMIPVPASQP